MGCHLACYGTTLIRTLSVPHFSPLSLRSVSRSVVAEWTTDRLTR